jgi:molecular chaperone DnaJ
MILGGDIVVTTITNTQISIKVPERCQARTVLRVRGHGIPKHNGPTGDLLIKINPIIPTQIDPDLVSAIQKWRS